MEREVLRSFALAGALILAGASLTVGLVGEAGAVTVAIDPEGEDNAYTTADGEIHVTVDLIVPEDQRLPVDEVRAVLESEADGDKSNASLTADVTCSQPIPDGCPATGDEAVPGIGFVGDVASGAYGPCDGYCFVTHTGYGYTEAAGYGYEQPSLEGEGYEIDDQGYGYGYDGDDLTLTFNVTIDTREIPLGTHWLTFVTETGSETLGEVQSHAEAFTVEAVSVEDVASGLAAEQAFTATENATAIVEEGHAENVSSVNVSFAEECANCSLSTTVQADNPDPGTIPDADEDVDGVATFYLDIDLVDDAGSDRSDTVERATINFSMGASELGPDVDPDRVVLRHFQDDEGTWVSLPTEPTSDPDQRPVHFEAETEGFSTFAPVILDDASAGPGGGGSGPSGGGGGGGGSPVLPEDVRQGEPFDAGPGEPVRVTRGLYNTPLEQALVTFTEDCEDCQLAIDERQAPPENLPDPTGYGSLVQPFEVTLTQDEEPREGAIDAITLEAIVPADQAPSDPATLTMLHGTDGDWHPPASDTTEALGDGNVAVNATFQSLSPFAIAADEQAPTIDAIDPDPDATVTTEPTITLDVQDNRGIDTEASHLVLGEREIELVQEDPTATCVSEPCQLVADVDEALLVGDIEAEATIADTSGHTTQQAWTYEVSAELTPAATCEIDTRSPGPSEVLGEADPTIEATYPEACAIDAAQTTLRLDGEPLDAEITEATIRDTVADPLAEGEHSVQVDLQTEDGVERTDDWTFTVDLTAPIVVETDPVDGGTITDDRPTIEVQVADETSRVDPRTVDLRLDGDPVDPTIEEGTLTFTPEQSLADGTHTLDLTFEDRAGNAQTYSWTVEVESGLAAWVWILVLLASIGALTAGGYALYRRRLPER